MRKELYFTLYDAENAAMDYAIEHSGLVVGMDVELLPLRGTIDLDESVDYIDGRYEKHIDDYPDLEKVGAVRVIDRDTLEDTALFGYIEDMID